MATQDARAAIGCAGRPSAGPPSRLVLRPDSRPQAPGRMSGEGSPGLGLGPLRAGGQQRPGPWGDPSDAAPKLPPRSARGKGKEKAEQAGGRGAEAELGALLKFLLFQKVPELQYGDAPMNIPQPYPLLLNEELDASEEGDQPEGAREMESEGDSDSERGGSAGPYDLTGRSQYLAACEAYGVVPISYFLQHMHDPELILMHRGLGPQGARALASALITNTSILKLNLSDNWLNEEGAAAIARMLRENCFITDLDLSDNKLGAKGAKALCAALKENTSVRRLRISGGELGTEAAKDIAEALMVNTKVELLDLSHNLLDEGAGEKLGPALAENIGIKELNLSWNHLRGSGAVIFSQGVGANTYLKVLDLSYNGFCDQGAAAVGEALKVNSVLEELNISNNRISQPGALQFSGGLKENCTLRILSMGRNPMRSEGCLNILRAIQLNPDSGLEFLDFSNIHLNRDFDALACSLKESFPRLSIKHGSPSL